ncbi:MAG: FHA domain-containing protein, partial [Gammaproteobacteria bacterium]
MAKLVLSFNDEVVKEYELDKEILTIGRKPDNDIQINNPSTSSCHAKVLTILNDSFVEDLDSTNGTFIGDNKITKYALQNGENIIIGNHQLKYVSANDEYDKNEFEQTMIIRPHAEGIAETEEVDKKFEKTISKNAADPVSAG